MSFSHTIYIPNGTGKELVVDICGWVVHIIQGVRELRDSDQIASPGDVFHGNSDTVS